MMRDLHARIPPLEVVSMCCRACITEEGYPPSHIPDITEDPECGPVRSMTRIGFQLQRSVLFASERPSEP